MQTNKNVLLAATFATMLMGAASAQAATCAGVLLSDARFSNFASLVQTAGLSPQLTNNAITVFAPTNAALNRIATVTQMLSGQSASAQPDFPKLQTLVRAHLVGGAHPEDQMRGKVSLSTLAGTGLAIDGTGQRGITLSTASANSVNLSGMHLTANVHVDGPAIACENGVVYPIDNALVQ